MTATKACTRHARETNRKPDEPRKPKATSDNNKAKRVEAAKPAAALAVAPDGTGNGGRLSGTATNTEPAPAPEPPTGAAEPDSTSQREAGPDQPTAPAAPAADAC